MKNKFILLIGFLFLFGIISANTIDLSLDDMGGVYSGDTIQRNLTITTNQDLWVYLIHDVPEGITLSYKNPIQVNGEENLLINVSFDKYLESGDYLISFNASAEGQSPVTFSSSRNFMGGGSSCKYDKDYDWECGEWSGCTEGIQTRKCKKYNNCGNDYGMLKIQKDCVNKETPIELEEGFPPKEKKFNLCWVIIPILSLIFILLITCIIVSIKQKRKIKHKI